LRGGAGVEFHPTTLQFGAEERINVWVPQRLLAGHEHDEVEPGPLSLVIGVLSGASNFAMRNWVRHTWGRFESMRAFFVVGRDPAWATLDAHSLSDTILVSEDGSTRLRLPWGRATMY